MKSFIFVTLLFLSGFADAQNVGIGTTTPVRQLHLVGTAEVLRIQGNTPWIGFMNDIDASYKGFIYYPDTSLVIGSATGSNQPIILAPNNIGLLYANAQQRVGIGTSNPEAKLHIETGINSEAIRLTSDSGPSISFRLTGNSSPSAPLIGVNTSVPLEPDFRLSTPAGSNYSIKFFTNDILRLSILDNGKVGIGESNPDAKLEVNGFSRFGSAAESAPKIKMKTLTGTTANTIGGFTLINHDLDASKIIGVTMLVQRGGAYYPPNHTANTAVEYEYFFDSVRFEIINKAGNSGLILNSPIKIFITYEE